MSILKISKHEIGDTNSEVFVIAEIGNNHNGSIERAFEMIDLAHNTGANCVKFQMRNMRALYRKKSLEKSGEDLSTEYILDLLEKYELSLDEHKTLKSYCDEKDILYMCTPWDLESLKILESLNVLAYKVASADFTNIELLDALALTRKPLIISTGMSSEEEIRKVTNYLNEKKVEFALLHCNSTYPAPFHGINLNFLTELKKIHPIVGYSGHERGTSVSLGAVALGAKVIERHFTLDRDMEGPDHAASLEPAAFKQLVDGIRELEAALGGNKRIVSQGELINRENLGKSIVAKTKIKKGDKISRDMIEVKAPGKGLSPLYINELVGKVAKKDFDKEDFFYNSDIYDVSEENYNFNFSRPWGIPVRYYDYKVLVEKFRPEIVEFHLSYSDMELNIDDYFDGPLDIGFVVHAPELFKDSHLMDLASLDDEYLQRSMLETQKVIDITRKLKKYFPNTKTPQIVANVGGFSRDGFKSDEEKWKLYEFFNENFKKLNCDGVEIIPQTMAPFPWHFGGQRYQNLFVLPEEISKYCEKFNLRMCLDISHSALVCNYYKIPFEKFLNYVAPFTTHLHLGDAKGVDGEGLQIGEGDLDFEMIGRVLKQKCPEATFIPEIWQGHKNDGEGFVIALKKLSGIL